MADSVYIAVDLGAESGRLVRGRMTNGGELTTEEVHRWPNRPVRAGERIYWDVLYLWEEIKRSLAAASGHVVSVGVDSWGVDYALLDADGRLLGNPVHYRDKRTDRGVADLDRRLSRAELYDATGIQFMPINTSCQLAVARGEAGFTQARSLLGIPDLFDYWLTGRKVAERTFASTTQLYDTSSREWSRVVIDALEIDFALFQELVDPGTPIGRVDSAVAEEIGLNSKVNVVAVASHDTASAVVAVPARAQNWAFISSGTWSLVGIEIAKPIVTDDARSANFTNEEGFGATTRFLKNVMGLWLVQECRREWERKGRAYGYDELVRMARNTKPLVALIDPDDPAFLKHGDMPARILSFLDRTGQPHPEGPGGLVRCIFESLALKYTLVLEEAERITGQSVEVIHIVGGGAQNHFLNQLVADATGRRVLAGPVEATVLGNLVVQAFAAGRVGSIEDMRAVVDRSTTIAEFSPTSASPLPETAGLYKELITKPKGRT